MSPEQFTYWLQGFVELNKNQQPTEDQWKSICEHLQTVFNKVTPRVGQTTELYQLLKDTSSGPLTMTC